MDVFGAVCVEGVKGCGKTWMSHSRVNSAINIADPTNNFFNRTMVSMDVYYAFNGDLPRLIDEWQEFPSLWDATKIKVDESVEKGRFILTGSSTPETKGIYHSGVARIGTLKVRTMSLFESGDSNGSVSLASMFDGEQLMIPQDPVSMNDLIYLSIRGGWPQTIGMSAKQAKEFYDSYLDLSISDVRRVDGVERDVAKLKAFLKSLARNESTTATDVTISRDIEESEESICVSNQTVVSYRDVFTRMFLIEDVPAYSPDLRSSARVGKASKRHLTDPALVVSLLDATPEKLSADLRLFGYVFESLCVRDLGIYASVLKGKLFHYRDGRGREIDAVIELSDGRWGAFEIKTGMDKVEDACKKLLNLKKFFVDNGWSAPTVLCVICGTCPVAHRRPDGVYVVPITSLRP